MQQRLHDSWCLASLQPEIPEKTLGFIRLCPYFNRLHLSDVAAQFRLLRMVVGQEAGTSHTHLDAHKANTWKSTRLFTRPLKSTAQFRTSVLSSRRPGVLFPNLPWPLPHRCGPREPCPAAGSSAELCCPPVPARRGARAPPGPPPLRGTAGPPPLRGCGSGSAQAGLGSQGSPLWSCSARKWDTKVCRFNFFNERVFVSDRCF